MGSHAVRYHVLIASRSDRHEERGKIVEAMCKRRVDHPTEGLFLFPCHGKAEEVEVAERYWSAADFEMLSSGLDERVQRNLIGSLQ